MLVKSIKKIMEKSRQRNCAIRNCSIIPVVYHFGCGKHKNLVHLAKEIKSNCKIYRSAFYVT